MPLGRSDDVLVGNQARHGLARLDHCHVPDPASRKADGETPVPLDEVRRPLLTTVGEEPVIRGVLLLGERKRGEERPEGPYRLVE